jgi:exonuclease III
MDLGFGVWNVMNIYRALKAVATELAKCNLDVAAIQEVTWEKMVVSQQTIIRFGMEMGVLITT